MKLIRDQHIELARLLNQAAENIIAASNIVRLAPFTDRAFYVGGTIQEWLIDPLREESASLLPVVGYQSVGYVGGPHRKKPPSGYCVPR